MLLALPRIYMIGTILFFMTAKPAFAVMMGTDLYVQHYGSLSQSITSPQLIDSYLSSRPGVSASASASPDGQLHVTSSGDHGTGYNNSMATAWFSTTIGNWSNHKAAQYLQLNYALALHPGYNVGYDGCSEGRTNAEISVELNNSLFFTTQYWNSAKVISNPNPQPGEPLDTIEFTGQPYVTASSLLFLGMLAPGETLP